MSAPNPKPTRQQLEELDALLQRMLSLPTSQLESAMSGQFGAPTTPVPQHMPSAPMMMQPPPTYSPPPPMPRPPMPAAPQQAANPYRAEPPRGESAWQIPLPAANGGAGVWPGVIDPSSSGIPVGASRIPAPAMPVNRLNVTTVPSPDEMNRLRDMPPMSRGPGESYGGPVIPMPAPLPSPAEQRLPFYLWPFGLLDRSMGGMMASFGLPGRWLGQGGGKILIGWAGLLMLGGAAAWGAMDYFGLSW